MKKTLTFIIALCCAINLMAFDEEDYRAYAASMREQVWKKTALPEFDNHRCPPSMKKESAVILASYDEVTIDQRKRLRGNAFNLTLYNVRQLTYNHIKRRMVAINDKQALERFSQFDYQAFKKDHTYVRSSLCPACRWAMSSTTSWLACCRCARRISRR